MESERIALSECDKKFLLKEHFAKEMGLDLRKTLKQRIRSSSLNSRFECFKFKFKFK